MGKNQTKKEIIFNKAIEILLKYPKGLRYSQLLRMLREELPDIPKNTIVGALGKLVQEDSEIYKPDRGVFRHKKFSEQDEYEEKPIREEKFYKPFADWLVEELEECTKAIALGKNKFKDKWGTPDVIGIREPGRSDLIKFTTEIISAEIKTNSKELITAFGQACSYKLFSHKSYIVIPKSSSPEDISRLDALGRIFGIGLVLFDNKNDEDPQFEIRVRPLKNEPDMFYVNKYLKLIEKELF